MNRTACLGAAAAIASLVPAGQAAADDPAAAAPQSAHEFVSMVTSFAPEGVLSFESLEPNGDDGFVMLGVVLQPPETDEPILINRVEVDRMDWVSMMAEEQPSFLTGQAVGIDIPVAILQDAPAEVHERFGERVSAHAAIDFDHEGNALDLRDLALTFDDIVGLSLGLDASGVPRADMLEGNPMAAIASLQLGGFEFELEDLGGLEDVLATAAEENGMTIDMVIDMARQQLPMVEMMLQGERGTEIARTLSAIIDDLPSLDAPVRISMQPQRPATFMDFMMATDQDPEDTISRLGIDVQY